APSGPGNEHQAVAWSQVRGAGIVEQVEAQLAGQHQHEVVAWPGDRPAARGPRRNDQHRRLQALAGSDQFFPGHAALEHRPGSLVGTDQRERYQDIEAAWQAAKDLRDSITGLGYGLYGDCQLGVISEHSLEGEPGEPGGWPITSWRGTVELLFGTNR